VPLFEWVLTAPQNLVEAVSDALVEELGALSVSVEDADANLPHEQPLFGEPGMEPPRPGWERSTVIALFDSTATAEAAAALLMAQDWVAPLQAVELRAVEEQDWVRLTQAQFSAFEVTQGFWIVPSWRKPPEEAQRILRLDPGLAFGTGTHPTTRMCLRWIAQQASTALPADLRVLDYGCGSGILGIACGLHGAQNITAVDIDPAAVQASLDNASANAVSLQCGLPDLAEGRYGWVIANILAQPLKILAPLLCGHLDIRGQLLLSGILERQAEEIAAAYRPWCDLEVLDSDESWILMGAQRR
jgi:ribosomal protein L11 methyltransferase